MNLLGSELLPDTWAGQTEAGAFFLPDLINLGRMLNLSEALS